MYKKMHLYKIYNVTYIAMTLLLRLEKKQNGHLFGSGFTYQWTAFQTKTTHEM